MSLTYHGIAAVASCCCGNTSLLDRNTRVTVVGDWSCHVSRSMCIPWACRVPGAHGAPSPFSVLLTSVWFVSLQLLVNVAAVAMLLLFLPASAYARGGLGLAPRATSVFPTRRKIWGSLLSPSLVRGCALLSHARASTPTFLSSNLSSNSHSSVHVREATLPSVGLSEPMATLVAILNLIVVSQPARWSCVTDTSPPAHNAMWAAP